MTWYAVLNSFMQAKQDRLKEFSSSPYWTKEDMQVVKEDFTETDIKNFFRRLGAIICNDAPCGLSVTTCPYCFRFECDSCPYGQRHGICASDLFGTGFSDYDNLRNEIKAKGYQLCMILTPEFYIDLFNRLYNEFTPLFEKEGIKPIEEGVCKG